MPDARPGRARGRGRSGNPDEAVPFPVRGLEYDREATAITADTMDRVPAHTPRHLNARIQRAIEERVPWYALRLPEPGGLAAIDRRLRELEEEWDIERVLEANAASISLLGVTASAALDDRRWLLLPAAVAGFLLQHAVQGWCPPVSVFRRLGVRAAAEIERERYALKALRGDFDDLPADGAGRARESLRAVRL